MPECGTRPLVCNHRKNAIRIKFIDRPTARPPDRPPDRPTAYGRSVRTTYIMTSPTICRDPSPILSRVSSLVCHQG